MLRHRGDMTGNNGARQRSLLNSIWHAAGLSSNAIANAVLARQRDALQGQPTKLLMAHARNTKQQTKRQRVGALERQQHKRRSASAQRLADKHVLRLQRQ